MAENDAEERDPTLQQLIAMRMAQLGVTPEELERRSAASGHRVSRAAWYQWLGTRWTNLPSTKALLGMAAALQVDPTQLVRASELSLGLRSREATIDTKTSLMVVMFGERSEREKAELLKVMESFTRGWDALREADGGGDR